MTGPQLLAFFFSKDKTFETLCIVWQKQTNEKKNASLGIWKKWKKQMETDYWTDVYFVFIYIIFFGIFFAFCFFFKSRKNKKAHKNWITMLFPHNVALLSHIQNGIKSKILNLSCNKAEVDITTEITSKSLFFFKFV